MGPLEGIKVLDFSTLLPGPLCTLLLAEAGAQVIKIERGTGDDMRAYSPKFDVDSVNFALLNRGKQSIVADLKSADVRQKIEALIREADVLVEQFRPGVMQRLGLGFEDVHRMNPRLIYCSITGYGQTGPCAQVAAHDLNYQAQTGMLGLSAGADGAPVIPPTLTADLAAGAYPAMINILLALRSRDLDGTGQHLDISMSDNLFPLMYWALGNGWGQRQWPTAGEELVTGGSPRYQIYRTSDDRHLAAAPMEEKFWVAFLDAIDQRSLLQEPDEARQRQAVARTIAGQPAQYWLDRLAGLDTCVTEIKTIEQAVDDPHFVARGLFSRSVTGRGSKVMPALPVPICPAFRSAHQAIPSPALGEHTKELLR